jgi:signal transduction histidine kinase
MKKVFMKKSPLFLILLLFSITKGLNSQVHIDSLLSKLEYAEKSDKPGLLNKLSWEHRNSSPEKAIHFGLKAAELAEELEDNESLTQSYSFIGVAFRILGNYSEALDFFYKGLELAISHHLTEQEGFAYINIANLLIYQEFYNQAIENLSKALIIADEIENDIMKGYVYVNTGRALLLKKEYPEALEKLYISLDIRKRIQIASQQAVSYKYIGDAYFEMQDMDQALVNYELVLETVDYETDKDLVANTYIKIAEIYLRQNDYKKARINAENSISIARSIGAKLIIRDSYKVLSQLYINTRDYKKASEFLACIIAYNDTLFNQNLSEKIFNLNYQYEKQLKEAEIDLLNKDIQINELLLFRSRIILISLSLILLLAIVLVIYYLQTSKHRKKQNQLLERQKEELKLANQTKDKMFLILGHDLRGPVGSLIPLLHVLLEEEEIRKNDKLVHIFNTFMQSIQAVNDLLENLLFWAQNQGGELVVEKEPVNLNLILEKVLLLYKGISDLKQITITTAIHEDFIVEADRNMTMLVVRNLISNAIKFTPRQGKVNVSMIRKLNFVEMCVSDNGIGFDKTDSDRMFSSNSFYTTSGTGNETGSGLGLTLCNEFVEKNNGRMWAESEKGKGSRFYIVLPSA